MPNRMRTHDYIPEDGVSNLYQFEPNDGVLTVGDIRRLLDGCADDKKIAIRITSQRRFLKQPIDTDVVILGTVGV